MEHSIRKMDGFRILCACLWEAGIPSDMRTNGMALRTDRLLDYYNQHLKLKEERK